MLERRRGDARGVAAKAWRRTRARVVDLPGSGLGSRGPVAGVGASRKSAPPDFLPPARLLSSSQPHLQRRSLPAVLCCRPLPCHRVSFVPAPAPAPNPGPASPSARRLPTDACGTFRLVRSHGVDEPATALITTAPPRLPSRVLSALCIPGPVVDWLPNRVPAWGFQASVADDPPSFPICAELATTRVSMQCWSGLADPRIPPTSWQTPTWAVTCCAGTELAERSSPRASSASRTAQALLTSAWPMNHAPKANSRSQRGCF